MYHERDLLNPVWDIVSNPWKVQYHFQQPGIQCLLVKQFPNFKDMLPQDQSCSKKNLQRKAGKQILSRKSQDSSPMNIYHIPICYSGWWFGTFFIFLYIGNHHPNWLIFFRGVETTNQEWMISPLFPRASSKMPVPQRNGKNLRRQRRTRT